MQTISLNNTIQIPILGFGTWELTGDECTTAVQIALNAGYRHIDTADRYGNHKEVGAAIAKSGIPRKELFLTSKIFPGDLTREAVLSAVSRFLEELNTEYLDLLLIHWPDRSVPIKETLAAMQECKEAGTIRAFGVSNFTIHHLQDALDTGFEIATNQVELHPSFAQAELRAFCKENNIAVTAYSPLARGAALKIPLIQELAEKYDATPSQIVINWIMSRGIIAIPKSSQEANIVNNLQSVDFTLDEADLVKIDKLPQTDRLVNPSFSDFNY